MSFLFDEIDSQVYFNYPAKVIAISKKEIDRKSTFNGAISKRYNRIGGKYMRLCN